MNCFVTGASGFIGANLAHELSARGHNLRLLLRPESDLRGLEGLGYEVVSGGLGDQKALVKAMRGCEWCFHVAASYHLWLADYGPMYRANVDGTRNVLQAAIAAGCERIVYTSTVGCISTPKPVDGRLTPTSEEHRATLEEMTNDYKRSKFLAEDIALELAGDGAPIVIVNPSAPVGPRDVKPTPTGSVILDYLNGAMPGYVETGLNYAHVRDVAVGHILAAERGQVGERYILGNASGNWTMRESFEVLAEITGRRMPMKVPYPVALLAAYVSEGCSKITRRPPKAPLGGVRMARHTMFFDPSKAIRELGLPQTPPRQAFEEAIEWFRANGYVKGRKAAGR